MVSTAGNIDCNPPPSRPVTPTRLIRSTYQSHNKYGLMIKTLFLSGARVDEFVHIRVEDLHLDGDPPQIYLSHGKKESNRYVPVLPALAHLPIWALKMSGCHLQVLYNHSLA